MGGALMQLVAYGAQDVFLTGTPEITFWKVSYRRHTNFAMESIEQTFSGQADFGRRVTCTISRNGDLCYRTYLQVTLPEINQSMAATNTGVYARWMDFIGEQLVAQVEVEIGGQCIDRQYGDWMHIWNQLTLTGEQQRGYFKMIGNTTQLTYITDPTFASVNGPCAAAGGPTQVCAPRNALPETTLYIPLLFWWNRNPGLALPLIALQYHEVKINLDLRPIGECLWAVNSLSATSGILSVSAAYQQSLVAASLYVDYIFLDTDERRKMAQNPHEYLFEQLQFTGDESVGSSSNKIKLNFNHPCKELIWVVQPDANVDYCSSLDATQTLYRTLGAQPFNYTDAIDALPNLSMLSVVLVKYLVSTVSSPPMVSSKWPVVWMLPPPLPKVPLPGHLLVSRTPGSLMLPCLSLPALVSPMPAPLCLPRPHWTCIVGARILALLLNYSLTAKTDSLNVKVPTSMWFNPSNTTPAHPILVSTCTPLLFAQKSINQVARAISRELITPYSNWCSHPLLSLVPPPPRSVCTQ